MNPLSDVLGEAWRIYRAQTAHLLTIAFVFYVASAVLVGLLGLLGIVGLFLGWIIQLFATFLLQATLIKAVQDVRDGRADLSFGETVSSAVPYIVPVAVASILAGIAITVGLILLIVPGLILITIWAVIIPVVVLERSGALASFGRSQRLVRGYGWPVFGTLVVLFIVQIVVGIVLGIIFSGLPTVLGHGLSTVIAGTIVAPFIAVAVTLIYYRLAAVQAGGPAYSAPGGYGTPPGGPYGGPGGPYPGTSDPYSRDPYAGPSGTPPYGTPPPGNPHDAPGSRGDWFGGPSGQ